MKIVHLLPELSEGGVELHVIELSRELTRLGNESIVISHGGKLVTALKEDKVKHIKFDVCSKNPLTAPWRVYKLRELLRELNADLIHAHSRVPAWLSYLANKRLHIPFVTTVHGYNSVSFYSKIMTLGDRIICVSRGVKSYIEQHYHTPLEKIDVIYGGVDTEQFNPSNIDSAFISQFQTQYNLHEKFIVSIVGRITQLKDIETFIRAIQRLKKETPSIKALIVGSVHEDKKDYFQTLKKLVQDLKLQDEILFTGSQSQIEQIYALSDVVVSSSKKPESFGRSVAEAIAMNTPVVATNHGGVREIIIDGVNGYFFEVGDEVELASKIIAAKNLAFDGYDYISETFSLQKTVKRHLDVYRRAVENG